ncbi:MAG: hypothetical protein ACI9MC_002579 [Kiritimatiellia bacterium]|jgi:hypothetical protein
MHTFFSTILFAGLLVPAVALAGGVKLGETDLTDAKDWDIVHLPACASSHNVPVTKIGVRVTRFAAQIDSLKVVFHNGSRQELHVKHHFKPGDASRWIDLNGDARCIKSIRIVGDADTFGWRPGKQAHVAFFATAPGNAPRDLSNGARSHGAAPHGAIPGPNKVVAAGGAVGKRLGMVHLKDAKDWDFLRLGNCPTGGNFPVTHIRVKVNDYPATINKLKVKFHNGQTQELNLRKHFAAGSSSVWHDLKGSARCVKSIHVVGDTDSIGWRPGKQAKVVFQGKNGN